MDLQEFKEHVHNWSVSVWRDRMPAAQKLLPSEEKEPEASQPKAEKVAKSKKKQDGDASREQKQFELPTDDEKVAAVRGDGKILVDDQKQASAGHSPGKPPRIAKPHTLTEEQKSKMYVNRLLLFKLEMYRLDIEQILDRYLQSKQMQNIDCKRHFDDVFDAFQSTVKVAICY